MDVLEKDLPKSPGENSSLSEDDGGEISRFFDDRSVFITGATGFVGTVIIATLLKRCPRLKKIYVLIRKKKNVDAAERMDKILKKKIFEKLVSTEVLGKVIVVPGDVSIIDLGVSEPLMKELREEISVVFHCAAIVSFTKPLGYIIKQNVIGTENIVKFCRRLQHLEVLVYTSSAYSFCNKFEIEDKVEMMQVPPMEIMDAARLGDEKKLLDMFDKCIPSWPNTYSFSKAVCENYLAREVKDLPLAIVRPSIIICSWEGVRPGYMEEGFGIVQLSLAVGKGFVRVVRCDPDVVFDIIPVDIVVNTHLTAAWYVHKNKPKDLLVLNCVSGCSNPTTFGEFVYSLFRMQEIYPLPNMYQKASIQLIKNKKAYWITAAFNHFAPALVLDFALILMAKKPKLTKLYLFFERCMDQLLYFVTNEWIFKCENTQMLIRSQTLKDKQMFPLEGNYTLEKLFRKVIHGSHFYDWSTDKRGFAKRMEIANQRLFITNSIKWMTVALLVLLLGSFLYKLYTLAVVN